MKKLVFTLFALLILSGCGAAGDPTGETAGGSLQGIEADTLRVVLAIGEELGDSTNTFGIIGDAEYHGGTGNIIILDTGRACLKEYTPEGQFIRQVSRRGDGPGELSNASFEFFQMAGRTLVINMMKQGFVVFDDSLAFLEEIQHWPSNPPMQCVALNDTTLAAYKPDFAENDGQNFTLYRRLVSFPYGQADYGHVFWADSTDISLSDLIANGTSDMINDFLLGLTVGGNESLLLMALRVSEEYRVQAWFPDGTEAFTITLDIEPVPKTPEEIAEEKAYMEAFFGQMGGQGMTEYQPKPFRDMIVSVDIGPDGNIWVQRGTMEYPFFDVFDLQGNLLGHKVFEVPGWTWQFSLSEQGILAWEDDPEEGYQQLFMVR